MESRVDLLGSLLMAEHDGTLQASAFAVKGAFRQMEERPAGEDEHNRTSPQQYGDDAGERGLAVEESDTHDDEHPEADHPATETSSSAS